MKKMYIIMALIMANVVMAYSPTNMTVPVIIRNKTNNLPMDGTYTLNFTLLPSDSNVLWNEEHTVATDDGIVSPLVGITTPITWGILIQNPYMQVQIDGGTKLRYNLSAAPFSIVSQYSMNYSGNATMTQRIIDNNGTTTTRISDVETVAFAGNASDDITVQPGNFKPSSDFGDIESDGGGALRYSDDSIEAQHINSINCGDFCSWDGANDEIDVDDMKNTTEQMQDASWGSIGTETLIDVTYQDGTDDVDFVVADMRNSTDDFFTTLTNGYICRYDNTDGDVDCDLVDNTATWNKGNSSSDFNFVLMSDIDTMISGNKTSENNSITAFVNGQIEANNTYWDTNNDTVTTYIDDNNNSIENMFSTENTSITTRISDVETVAFAGNASADIQSSGITNDGNLIANNTDAKLQNTNITANSYICDSTGANCFKQYVDNTGSFIIEGVS